MQEKTSVAAENSALLGYHPQRGREGGGGVGVEARF